MEKKIAVITAIAGGFDKLHEPKYYDENVDYIAFVDQNVKSDIWQIMPIEYTHFVQSRMAAKIYKILIHKYCDYEYILWVDGSIILIGSINGLVDNFLGQADMALFKHRFRNCVYEEHKDDTEEIRCMVNQNCRWKSLDAIIDEKIDEKIERCLLNIVKLMRK